jgi:hypothetical protein
VLLRAPGSELRLSLDTSAAPELSPQHPARDVHVTDRDELVVFDQAFERVRAPPRRPRAPRMPSPPRTVLPYAIRAGR